MTLVVDASVLIELLTMSPLGQRAAARMRADADDLHLPHLADVETVSVARGLVAAGVLEPSRAANLLVDLRDFPARRWPAQPFFERIWELRANVTAYDATNVALAEALGARLLTADRTLARGVGGVAACPVELVE
ncbi:type II toxin-antitoxin system VapC family toxin [Microbacterium luticocti]|uniref:type II toxin-antitoxin system VapC family toxin n=1 Tax=Microbacterium luticocti TaxID=451764 RepID=UPI00040D29A9|nr:type II toxin-antitoxin system VapC family toxin [Microbacterium luticocti]